MENSSRVWWVQCKPFREEDRNSEEAKSFQRECLEKRFFGMGWKWDEFNVHAGKEFTWDLAAVFKTLEHSRAFSSAQNRYGEMKAGDVAMTRLNDVYYLGKLKSRPRVSDREHVTWYAEVDEWRSLGGSIDLPHHVRGKLAGRNYHGTVAEITGLSALTLLELAGVACEKRNIGADDFFTALGDEDLEDLMAHYMAKENPAFVFLPSSCKKNTPGIEYVMYDPETGKKIACQTKVNRWIDVKGDFGDPVYRSYETIYLFSGAGYYNPDPDLDNLRFVEKEALYALLKTNALFSETIGRYFAFT